MSIHLWSDDVDVITCMITGAVTCTRKCVYCDKEKNFEKDNEHEDVTECVGNMSPEKMFIRDLILLCESYGMVVCFPSDESGLIIHKNGDNLCDKLYNDLLNRIKELE